jgi:uncharacterized phage-associated protein
MPTVFDVAAHIRARLGDISKFKLNKLAYYVQAWSLAWNGRPAFAERIEAWKDGPVPRDLWVTMTHERGRRLDNAIPLSSADAALVDRVLQYYGAMSDRDLIDLTHQEGPWQQARGDLPPEAKSSNVITLESMAEYYQAMWREVELDKAALAGPNAFVGSVDEFERLLDTY